jgi:hypothetical protein
MTDDQHAILDDLLSRWHQWQPRRATTGYAPKSLVCGAYRTSRQYDDTNGALDDDLNALRCRQVDHDVCTMHDPHRAAIYVLARNLATGANVWISPRLPADPGERASIVSQARVILTKKLIASGVL